MQCVLVIVCTRGESLRDKIATDRRIGNFQLEVTEQKRTRRHMGWSKVHSTQPGVPGAINVQWDAHASLLVCRVITRGAREPHQIIGAFTQYLLATYYGRICAINIYPE